MLGAEIETYAEMMGRMFGAADADMMADDPVLWVRGNGEEVWSKQAEILESVRDNRYTAVHSAHDMGKSFIASRAIAWWISSHPPGSAFVVSTAPSAAQVAAIMWREVGKIHKKAGLVGQINRAGYPQWYIDGELVGYGRKPADYEQSAFQGIHAEFVLIVIDEACGVSQHLYDAVDSLATNENARVLAIGNPDDPTSHFAKVCSTDQGWNTIHLDGLRSPNITYDRVVGPDPENPKWPLLAHLMEATGVPYSTEEVPDDLRPMLINEQWIEERIVRWAGITRAAAEHTIEMQGVEALHERIRTACEGSSLFTAKVRGTFPTSATEGVVPLGWVQRAVERWHDLKSGKTKRKREGNFILGIDVARSGDDETVFAHRYGSEVTRLEKMRLDDTMEVADRASVYLTEPRSTAVVDVIGIGAGVYDRLRRMRNDGQTVGQVIPFNASAQSNRKDRLGQFVFRNDRAAAWWNMREMLDPTYDYQIALPDDEALIEELVAPRWGHYVGGKIKVEEKDEIKKRLGRSTDSADAVIHAFWVTGESGAGEGFEYGHSQPAEGSQNPLIPYEGYENFAFDTLSVHDVDFSDI